MRKQAEQYKADILRHLEQEDRQPPPSEVVEAQRIILQFEQGNKDRVAQIQRALSPLPPGDLCPSCFVKRGVTSHMSPISSDNTDIDLFTCKTCGLIIEVKP
jgi:hypothetical protein